MSEPQMTRHSWLVTLLLAIFLGTLGIHRFYTANYIKGVIWLCTGGLFGVGWIVDMILILFNRYRDGNGNLLVK